MYRLCVTTAFPGTLRKLTTASARVKCPQKSCGPCRKRATIGRNRLSPMTIPFSSPSEPLSASAVYFRSHERSWVDAVTFPAAGLTLLCAAAQRVQRRVDVAASVSRREVMAYLLLWVRAEVERRGPRVRLRGACRQGRR